MNPSEKEWQCIPMHLLKAGMRISFRSSRVELMTNIPWEVLRSLLWEVVGIPTDSRVWMGMHRLRVGMRISIQSLRVVMRIPLKSFRVWVKIPMHFSSLENGVDGYSNALPKGRDVACHSFPKSRSDDIHSLGNGEDPYWFPNSADVYSMHCLWVGIPWRYWWASLEIFQSSNVNPNALLKAMVGVR